MKDIVRGRFVALLLTVTVVVALTACRGGDAPIQVHDPPPTANNQVQFEVDPPSQLNPATISEDFEVEEMYAMIIGTGILDEVPIGSDNPTHWNVSLLKIYADGWVTGGDNNPDPDTFHIAIPLDQFVAILSLSQEAFIDKFREDPYLLMPLFAELTGASRYFHVTYTIEDSLSRSSASDGIAISVIEICIGCDILGWDVYPCEFCP